MDREYIEVIRDRSNEIIFQIHSCMFELIGCHGSIVALDAVKEPQQTESSEVIKGLMLAKISQVEGLLFDYKNAIKILKDGGKDIDKGDD